MNKIYTILLLLLVFFAKSVHAQNYNFRIANSLELYNNRAQWLYNLNPNQQVPARIELTNNQNNLARYLYTKDSFNYTASCFEFDASFNYYFSSNNNIPADGMSFYFASSSITALSSGQNLAIPSDLRGIGLVIDFYNNGNLSFSNGNNASVSLVNFDGNYTYQEGSSIDNNKLAHFYTKLVSDSSFIIKMTYMNNRINIFFDNVLQMNVPYTLSSGIGRFGFSASTGALSSIQEISDININVKTFLSTLKDSTFVCQNEKSTYRWRNKSLPNTNDNQYLLSDTIKYNNSVCDSVILDNFVRIVNIPDVLIKDTICASDLPYRWNSQTVNTIGNHILIDNRKGNIINCDSNTRLELYVKPNLTASLNLTICENALPFTWHNNTVNTSGRFTLSDTSLSSVTGCDSITTLTLLVNPTINTSLSHSICVANLPFVWNGQTVNTVGNFTLIDSSLSQVTGCDSITTMNVIVNSYINVNTTHAICVAALPYVWNGQTVTTIGSYTLIDSSISLVTGCDSITTLSLVVNPFTNVSLAQTICVAALPFVWNGHTINAVGSYTLIDTATSIVTGCDSITTLSLVVNPFANVSLSQTICARSLPFIWNGQTVNIPGTYTLIDSAISSVTGCDSITTLTLLVNPTINISLSQSICATTLPFVWNGQNVNTVGNFTLIDSSLSQVTGCDSITTLILIVNENLQVNMNRSACESELPITWNNHTITTIGTHILRDTSMAFINGCDSVTILNLIVNPTLRTNLYDTLCQQLLPYTWLGNTVNTVGTHILIDTQKTITNCDSIITNTVWVRPTLTVTISDTVCENNLPYTWNNQSIHTIGNHILIDTTASLLTGCDSVTTLQLVVNPIEIDSVYEYVCYTSLPFVFNGSSYSTAGYYTQLYQNQYNCDSIIVLNLEISSPVTDTIINITACDSADFENNSYYTTTTIIDTLFNAVGCDSVYREIRIIINKSNLITQNVTICADQQYFFHNNYFNATGKYYANYTNIMGCDSIYVLNLTVKNLPEVKITPLLNEKVCLGDTIILVGDGAQNYLWEGKVIGNNSDSAWAKLYYSENKFEMIGIDSNGCQQNAQITLFAENCCDIGVPNAFSPNNDGLNDIYKIVGVGNPRRFELQIYNRYGHIVYKSYKQSEGWDGTINGKPAEIGTYSYILMTECADGTPAQQKGNIHLIR